MQNSLNFFSITGETLLLYYNSITRIGHAEAETQRSRARVVTCFSHARVHFQCYCQFARPNMSTCHIFVKNRRAFWGDFAWVSFVFLGFQCYPWWLSYTVNRCASSSLWCIRHFSCRPRRVTWGRGAFVRNYRNVTRIWTLLWQRESSKYKIKSTTILDASFWITPLWIHSILREKCPGEVHRPRIDVNSWIQKLEDTQSYSKLCPFCVARLWNGTFATMWLIAPSGVKFWENLVLGGIK